MFHPLTEQDMKQIVTLLAKNLTKRCKEQMDIDLTLTSSLKEYIIEEHSDAKMGARPLKRYIQKYVETLSARLILEDKVKQGDTILITAVSDGLAAQVKE